MQIFITTIRHKDQKYETLGDYRNGVITISKLGNEDYEFLVAIHELVEMYLTHKRGIKEEDITKFDIAYEESGKQGEPGDEPSAPYYKEHQVATVVERMMCNELGLNWQVYEKFLSDFIEKNHEDREL